MWAVSAIAKAPQAAMRTEDAIIGAPPARVSRAVFAAVLNTSLSTVQKWEAGDNKPSGPSLKLLSLIERKGLESVI